MNTNQKYNQVAIKQFRKELTAMFGDIMNIDIKCLNKAVNIGLADVKRNTPVGQYSPEVNFTTKDGRHVHFTTAIAKQGGFMRKSWHSSATIKSGSGIAKSIENTADYASYVNDGHRIVNKSGETVGWVKGKFILEKAINKVDKALQEEFRKEVERVNKIHDK